MCDELIVWPDTDRSKLIEGQGQLAEFVGGDLIFKTGAPPGAPDPNGCLCWVDLKAMGERHGFDAEYDGVFYYWRDRPAAQDHSEAK